MLRELDDFDGSRSMRRSPSGVRRMLSFAKDVNLRPLGRGNVKYFDPGGFMVADTCVPARRAVGLGPAVAAAIGLVLASQQIVWADQVAPCDEKDCRGNFEAAVFTGVAIDTFAAKDLKSYINPDDSSEIRE